ncbi:MAG: hypothetical protein ACI4IQ_06445 [Eubacterium sp.]
MLVCLTALLVFAGCSNDSSQENTSATSATAPPAPMLETDAAKIKDVDALDFIKNSYTEEELGLDETDKDYSFMIASKGVEIEDKEYVKVVANVMKKNNVTNEDGKETFSLETIGEYFISFDGQTVLKKDMKTNEYTELENRYQDYKSKGETTTENAKD